MAADRGARPALRARLARHRDHKLGGRRRRNWQRAAERAGDCLQLDDRLRVADHRLTHCQRRGRHDIIRNPPEAQEGSHWLYDARIGIGAADDRWDISLWGKNLADEQYPLAGNQLERRLRRDLGHAADVWGDVFDADVAATVSTASRRGLASASAQVAFQWSSLRN